ncbi:alkylglycerol monooxygenase [Trichonephila inaurata madagascariensis]|uniref:Alkylglycerol monooxygenase n=1 Tax=Trichonephila inaurata madagascariensis TaxID=2747483 RepID=A0A8X7BYN6_9ARAC|nr:alkylglycerol monooxygenase [Trichonephila inaurata madagascariensis]
MEYLSVESLGYLFYTVSPNRTTYEAVDEVPNYIVETIPWILIFVVVERAFFSLSKRPLRINDLLGSASQGLMTEISRHSGLSQFSPCGALEVNILWAAHQVHHSSEDYTLSTALRQSVLLSQLLWVFYLPAALVVPPAPFWVHFQLNFTYQFWLHTEVINRLDLSSTY